MTGKRSKRASVKFRKRLNLQVLSNKTDPFVHDKGEWFNRNKVLGWGFIPFFGSEIARILKNANERNKHYDKYSQLKHRRGSIIEKHATGSGPEANRVKDDLSEELVQDLPHLCRA